MSHARCARVFLTFSWTVLYCLGDDAVGFCDDGYIGVNDGEDDGECEEDDGDGEDVVIHEHSPL